MLVATFVGVFVYPALFVLVTWLSGGRQGAVSPPAQPPGAGDLAKAGHGGGH
jgi:hypothetical protein